MQLSNHIRSFRKERGLTQEQLAEALGVTASAVYKWEAGRSIPDLRLIVGLADLFDTSVDVLLGYEVRNDRQAAAAARLKDFVRRRDARGIDEADRLAARYPNCFGIVYQGAKLYGLFGFLRRDQKLLRRSVELMQHARLLLGQNTDPETGELSIQYSIAQAYLAMGENGKAAEIFQSNNPQGIWNDYIGCILSKDCGRPDEALPCLSRALLHCASSMTWIVIGYFHAYYQRGEFAAAADVVRMGQRFFAELKKPGQTGFLDKTAVELNVCLAAAQTALGDTAGAERSLRAARALAQQFDRAPDYDMNHIRFMANDRPATAYDNTGATAMACIENLLHTFESEALTALWHGIAAEGQSPREVL